MELTVRIEKEALSTGELIYVGEIAVGTLAAIIRQSGLPRNVFEVN